MPVEGTVDVLPGRLTPEHEVVQPGEQAQREVPRQVRSDVVDPRVVRESTAQLGVQRRTAVAEDGLPLEDLLLPVYSPRAALACAASSPNFAGSLIARSARILRSSSTFAALRPAMKRL